MHSGTYFTKGFLFAQGVDITMKGLGDFLDKRECKD